MMERLQLYIRYLGVPAVLLTLALVVVWIGWFGWVKQEPGPTTTTIPILELIQNEIIDLDEIWCEGFAAGQVVVGSAQMGKPSLEDWESLIASCLKLGFPSRPLTTYFNAQ